MGILILLICTYTYIYIAINNISSNQGLGLVSKWLISFKFPSSFMLELDMFEGIWSWHVANPRCSGSSLELGWTRRFLPNSSLCQRASTLGPASWKWITSWNQLQTLRSLRWKTKSWKKSWGKTSNFRSSPLARRSQLTTTAPCSSLMCEVWCHRIPGPAQSELWRVTT